MNFAEQLKKKGLNLRFPEWKAEKERHEAELIRQRDAKIFGLLKQGKTVEEVEALLAQEAASGSLSM